MKVQPADRVCSQVGGIWLKQSALRGIAEKKGATGGRGWVEGKCQKPGGSKRRT